MSISASELVGIYGLLGVGKIPVSGGPAGNLRPTIAQSIPLESIKGSSTLPSLSVFFCAIAITAGQTITNINVVTATTAESGGSHCWFALYDDGRGSPTAGQLALLGQTADQTGATFLTANTNVGLSLLTPYVTTYSGIYYVAFFCNVNVGVQAIASGSANRQIYSYSNSPVCATTSSTGITSNAPNPSGALTPTNIIFYAYVS